MGCLFCNDQEPNYYPAPNKDFICSSCVQLLLSADQEDLKRAYTKAFSLGYQNKARAIESFLMNEENTNEQKRPETRKFSDRKRNTRIFRDKKRAARKLKTKRKPPVYQD